MESCVYLDHYARAQSHIDWSARLGTDSFEAGQPKGVETAISRSDDFESIRTASKLARQLQTRLDGLKQSGRF